MTLEVRMISALKLCVRADYAFWLHSIERMNLQNNFPTKQWPKEKCKSIATVSSSIILGQWKDDCKKNDLDFSFFSYKVLTPFVMLKGRYSFSLMQKPRSLMEFWLRLKVCQYHHAILLTNIHTNPIRLFCADMCWPFFRSKEAVPFFLFTPSYNKTDDNHGIIICDGQNHTASRGS